jgi:hypothetical protein
MGNGRPRVAGRIGGTIAGSMSIRDKGNEQARAYLEKVADKGAGVKVTISGKVDGDKIEVSSIKDADSN